MQLSEGSNIASSSLPSAPSANLQQQHPQQQQSEQQVCFGCKKSITDRYLLKAVDRLWHEDCLKCSCCDCRLGEVGSTLFTRADLLFCRRDYLRLFGATGYCSICAKLIPAFEMVMRAKGNVYHLECFACQQCSHRFCVGDRYYLLGNKILCEYDYEERMMLAGQQPYLCNCSNQSNTTSSSSNPDTSINNHHGKHQHMSHGTNHHLMSDDVSSGYGSPSPTSI